VLRYAKCPSILIDGSGAAAPQRYESGVVEQLDRIRRSQVGSALLWAVHDDGVLRRREVYIVSHAAGAHRRGRGSGRCPVVWDGRGTDDRLLHELVHALRRIREQSNRIGAAHNDHENEEEFFASLVTNIYRSEQYNGPLPGDPSDRALPGPPANRSEEFLGKGAAPPSRGQLENRRLVNKFVCENWGLCNSICWNVAAAFNPIREYLYDPGLYPHDPDTAPVTAMSGREGRGAEMVPQTGQKPSEGIQRG
jgi:hypothetical protein